MRYECIGGPLHGQHHAPLKRKAGTYLPVQWRHICGPMRTPAQIWFPVDPYMDMATIGVYLVEHVGRRRVLAWHPQIAQIDYLAEWGSPLADHELMRLGDKRIDLRDFLNPAAFA